MGHITVRDTKFGRSTRAVYAAVALGNGGFVPIGDVMHRAKLLEPRLLAHNFKQAISIMTYGEPSCLAMEKAAAIERATSGSGGRILALRTTGPLAPAIVYGVTRSREERKKRERRMTGALTEAQLERVLTIIAKASRTELLTISAAVVAAMEKLEK